MYLEREIERLAAQTVRSDGDDDRLRGMRTMLAYQAGTQATVDDDLSDFPDIPEGLRRLPNKGGS